MYYRLSAIGYLLAFALTISCTGQQTGDLSSSDKNSDPILSQISSFFNNPCVGTIPQNLTSGADFCVAANKATASNKDSLGKLYADNGNTYYYQIKPFYSTFYNVTYAYESIPVNAQTTLWYLTSNGALISNPTLINADKMIIMYDSSSKQMTSYYYSSFTESQFQVSSTQLTPSNAQTQAQTVLSTLIGRIKNMKARYAKAIPAYMNEIGDKSQTCAFVVTLAGIPYCNYLAYAGGPVFASNDTTGAVPTIYPNNGNTGVLPAYLYNNLEENPNNQVWYNTTNAPYAPPYENSNDDYSYYVFNPDNVTLSQWYYSTSQQLSVAVVRGFPVQQLSGQTNTNTGKWQDHYRLAVAQQASLGPAGIAAVTTLSVVTGAAFTYGVISLVNYETAATVDELTLSLIRTAEKAAAESGQVAGPALRAINQLGLTIADFEEGVVEADIDLTAGEDAATIVTDAVAATANDAAAAAASEEAISLTVDTLGAVGDV